MTLARGMPADFMAVSSERSPKFPKVMSAANNTARGSDFGTKVSAA